jgi:hypothetical protein
VDVGADQLDASHHGPAQVHAVEPGAGQIDVAKLRSVQVNALKPGAAQVGTNEVRHGTTLAPPADEPGSGRGRSVAAWKVRRGIYQRVHERDTVRASVTRR